MNETISRAMVLFESIILLAPLSLLNVFMLDLSATQIFLQREPPINGVMTAVDLATLSFCIALIVSMVVQILAWIVVVRFVVGGRASLCAIRPLLFSFLTTAALFVCFATLASSTDILALLGVNDSLKPAIGIMARGLPALIPYLHIAVEYRISTTKLGIELAGT